MTGSMPAISGQILTPGDHMVAGAQLGQAGFDEAEVSNLMRLIEERAFQEAKQAARNTAMSMLPLLTDMIKRTHAATAMEIYRQLSNQTGGWGGTTIHAKCARIAYNVASSIPRHEAPAAEPIIGSVR